MRPRPLVSLDAMQAMQWEREGRARAMLAQNPDLFHKSEEPQTWFCCGTLHIYRVSLETCDCPDYAIWHRHIPGFTCKHMVALKLWLPQHEKEKENTMSSNENENGWVKLFHPAGVQCTIPLSLSGAFTAEQAEELLTSVSNLLNAGWLVDMPGLEPGETREPVSYLARRQKINDDKTKTDVIDVYCGDGKFKTVHLYMNDAEDFAQFTDAFGIQVGKLPIWEGDQPIERGKKPERDREFLIPVSGSGVDVVWTLNPRYEGENDKKHAKRLFVRWERRRPKPAPSEVVKANLATLYPEDQPEQSEGQNPRCYSGGEVLNEGNSAEVEAFEAFEANNGRVPYSRQALRDWIKQTAK